MCHVCKGVPRGQKRAGITGGDELSCVGAGSRAQVLSTAQDSHRYSSSPQVAFGCRCERLSQNIDQVLKILEYLLPYLSKEGVALGEGWSPLWVFGEDSAP